MNKPKIMTAALMGLYSMTASAALITNGGFESGLAGWTVADQLGSDGTFFLQSGTLSPANGFTVPAPPEGSQAAMSDAGAGGSHVLYQDFTVPVGTSSGTISFALFINNGAGQFHVPSAATTGLNWGTAVLNQQVRVDILGSSAAEFSVDPADVLQNLYQSATADPLLSGYSLITVDISALLAANQGNSVRLRFAEVDNVSFLNLGVDSVDITTSAVPEPASFGVALAGLAGLAWRRSRLR